MIKILILLAIGLFTAGNALAGKDPVYTSLLSNTGAGGYDAVSYFTSGEPIRGSTKYTTEYMGATWRFSTAENLALFKEDPERYAPAYGGYCAWAVSQGNLAKGDPQHWTIKDGRLYLNYDKSVHDRWLKDTEAFIRQADGNWPEVLE